MTEKELRQNVISQAVSWLGCNEQDGSFKKIIDAYNAIRPLPSGYHMSYVDPWCAAFVSAVGSAVGLTDAVLPECSCDRMIAKYKAAGRWVEQDNYSPQPGDLVFYDWDDDGKGDCTGSSDHVGLVVATTPYYFRIIEGNKSDAVGYRTIAKDSRFIRGFALPNYAAKADGASPQPAQAPTPEPIKPTAPICNISLKLPTLKSGSTGETVRSVQLILIGRNFACGGDGADGVFGPATRQAVCNFQTDSGIDADGIVGLQTFGKLLGVM